VSTVERDAASEHEVTPLELFFDLVFVFAITQVTTLITHDPSWGGVLRGMLVLAAVWWAWTGYAWLTSTLDFVGPAIVRLRGWRIAPRHFAERHGLVILIALGESIVAHVAFLARATGRLFRRRTIGGVVLLTLIPAATTIPALAALALVSAVCSAVVAYEALRYRDDRARVRHPELAG
jgi:low temperature requirement protein LtrA